MPAYRVTKPVGAVGQSYGGSDGMIVFAGDAGDAKAIAQAEHAGGDSDAAWAGATVTELVERTDLETFVFNILIEDGATIVSDNTYTGLAADQIDELGDAMVIVLNATAEIAASTYDDSTNILTVAAIGDGIGDHTITVTIKKNGTDIPGMHGAVVHEGIGAAVLTVQLATDAIANPQVYEEVKFV
jgi:hypothetical protein